MKKMLFLLIIPLLQCSSSPLEIPKIQAQIQDILGQQKKAWDAEDLAGFMDFYWKSENLTFQSGGNRLLGWEALHSRYKTTYSGKKRGTLDFTDISINVLSENVAYVLGRWELEFKDSSRGGLFTIIFKRMASGWKIIHDHTS